MIYLNTVPDGSTMFLDQDMTIDAEVGKLLIARICILDTYTQESSKRNLRKVHSDGIWHVYTKQSDDWTI